MSEPSAGPLGSVLIVTGSEQTRRMYAEYLSWRGVDAREVHSAAEAVGDLMTRVPQAVAIEDRLPDSTGQELVRVLRRSRHTFQVPIVLLASNAFGIRSDNPGLYGCDLVLTVPLLPDALFDALTSIVRESRSRSAERPFESWLFSRAGESVWMVRTADLELSVAGPQYSRGVFSFGEESDLMSFQADYQQRLVLTGFELKAAGSDRRSGRDRRQQARPTGDRRAPQ